MEARNPGIKPWTNVASVSRTKHDSLEAILRQPLNLTMELAPGYGTARRGNWVVEDGQGRAVPVVAAHVISADGTRLNVEYLSDIEVGAVLQGITADGTLDEVTVTSVSKRTHDTYTGIASGEDYITVDVAPATPLVGLLNTTETDIVGVVYESTLEKSIPVTIVIEGAWPEKFALGLNPELIVERFGATGKVKLFQGMLFVRTF